MVTTQRETLLRYLKIAVVIMDMDWTERAIVQVSMRLLQNDGRQIFRKFF